MTLDEYRDSHPKLQAAEKRLLDAQEACRKANRWGESRRFAGRMAGNRLARIDKARAAWSRMLDRVIAEYEQKKAA